MISDLFRLGSKTDSVLIVAFISRTLLIILLDQSELPWCNREAPRTPINRQILLK